MNTFRYPPVKLHNLPLWSILILYFITILIPPNLITSQTLHWRNHLIHLSHILYIGVIGFAVLASFLEGHRIDIQKDMILLLLTAVWLMAWYHSVDRKVSLQSTLSLLLKGPAVGWVILKNVQRFRQAALVWHGLLIGILLAAAIGLLGLALASYNLPFPIAIGGRLEGTLGHPLPLGTLLVFGLALVITSFPRFPAFRVPSTTLLMLALFLTISRSSWGIALVVLFALAVSLPEARPLLKKTFIPALFYCAFLIPILLWVNHSFSSDYKANAAQRLSFLSTSERKAPSPNSVPMNHSEPPNPPAIPKQPIAHAVGKQHRIAAYGIVVKMWRARPLLGWGLGTLPQLYTRYAPPEDFDQYLTPDNMYLRLLSESGLVGLLTCFILLGSWLRASLAALDKDPPNQKVPRKALIIATTGILLNSLFFDSFYWNSVFLTLSISMALTASPWYPNNHHFVDNAC